MYTNKLFRIASPTTCIIIIEIGKVNETSIIIKVYKTGVSEALWH